MELGERIKTLRTERGLSQEALAARLEISRQAVAKWEIGQSRPSTANLLALCGVFEVPLDQLAAGETVPEPAPDRPGSRWGKLILPALTLLSLAVSVITTNSARNIHFPEQIIGGADGPTSILISGPYLFGVPAQTLPLWGLTGILAVAAVVVFLRGRRKR